MTIQLRPGFKGTIHITDMDNKVLYTKKYATQKYFNNFLKKYGESREGYGFVQSVLAPVRTQNLSDLSKDVFLPAVANYSLQSDSLKMKLLTTPFAFALDAITLPIRLCTAPFRIYNNHYYPEAFHPIVKLIKNPNLQKVQLLYTQEIVAKHTVSGDIYKCEKHITTAKKLICLKALHGTETSFSSKEKTIYYSKYKNDQEWSDYRTTTTSHVRKHFAF